MTVLSVIFEYGASLFDSILCVWFMTKFNKKSFKLKQNPYWIPAILVIFAYTIFSDHFLANVSVITSSIFVALFITYALLIEHKKWLNAVFSTFCFEIPLILINTGVYLVISLALKDFEAALQGEGDGYVRYAYLLLIKIALFAVCKLLLFIFRADNDVDLSSGLLSFAFSVISIVGITAAMSIGINAESTEIGAAAFGISIAVAVLNALLYWMIARILKLQRHKMNEKLLEDKLRYEQTRYDEVTTMWSDIRKVRHDMKQQLTVIDGYLQEGKTEQCRSYVEKLLPTVEKRKNIVHSDNNVIDYIINTKLGGLTDTVVLVTGSIGDLSDIEESDLAALLGNMLDNAVEATRDLADKRIELLFARQDSSRMILCKNTVAKSVLAGNRALKTTKKDDANHGYGVQVMKHIVAKYGGLIDFFESSDMFGVQILFPER